MDGKTTYYQRNWEIILNWVNEHYGNNKERLREQTKNKYRELFDEEKEIKREYGGNRYHNMSEENKQTLKEYQRIIVEQKKSKSNILYNIKWNKKLWFMVRSVLIKIHFIKIKNQLI